VGRAGERVGPWTVEWGDAAPRALLRGVLDALAEGATPAGAETVKRSASRSVLRLPGASGPGVFVKCYPQRRRLRAPARREFANLGRLARLEIRAVEPLAVARLPGHFELLATRELAAAEPVGQRLAAARPPERDALLDALALLARRLHEAGLWHRDLHTGNVLVADAPASGPALVLVDVQRLRALPLPLPAPLRVRDLALLYHDLGLRVGAARERLLERYRGPAAPPEFVAAVERAAERHGRRRLRSRGRRCVRNSTGFRIERRGALRFYRRADAPVEAILSALERHRAQDPAPCAGHGSRTTRVEGIRAGPPPGPPASLFDRGQGAAEAGAPAVGPVAVTEFRERGLAGWLGGLLGRHRGMRAWREAHARLLRGHSVPAPIALVEERRAGRLRASWFLARHEGDPATSANGDVLRLLHFLK